jgi:hypothetical protein
MKILLALLLLTFTQSDKESKQAEKERLKRPAEVTIKAPASKIRPIFLAEYARHGWQLEKETQSSLTFTTRGGVGAALAYGRGAKLEDIVTLIENDSSTLVMIDCGALAPRPGGHWERFNINSDKKGRKLTEALLQRVKEQAEK